MESAENIRESRLGKWCLICTLGLVVVCLAVVSTRVYLKPFSHSVFPIYSFAASNWQDGKSCYFTKNAEREMDVYRYSPAVTPLFLPFHFLGEKWGGILWRFVNFGLYLHALSLVYQIFLSKQPGWVGLSAFILLSLPLGLTNLNNGQVNLLMAALIMHGVSLAALGRISLSGFVFALATCLKIYPLAIALMIGMAFPLRFFASFIGSVVLIFLTPFLFQTPDYVASQYSEWFSSLAKDDRSQRPLADSFRDFWLLIRLTGAPIFFESYRWIQLAAAGFVGMASLFALWKRGFSQTWITRTTALGCSWVLLFGPSSESSTFVLIAPWLAMSLIQVFRGEIGKEKTLLLAGTGLLVLTVLAGILPATRRIHSFGFHPVAAVCLFFFYFLTITWCNLPAKNSLGEIAPGVRTGA
ncbi:MAG: DUF2029 domain-containing protein [Gemmataceae bacterium]|nr:DUF2029 domain-containing protein [Gemmataceae bacterium]